MDDYERFWRSVHRMDYASLRRVGERIVVYMEADPDDLPNFRDALAVADFLFQIAENVVDEEDEED